MNRRTIWRAASVGAAALALATLSTVNAQADGLDVKRDLALARAATAAYHNEAIAVADGYARTDDCVSGPEGVMGYHYIKPSSFASPPDVRQPQAVLYQPDPDGGRRLVAVEYIVRDADQNLDTDNDRPYLFGQAFDGPLPGPAPGDPIRYQLHAWIWQVNPAGTFTPWNPAGSC